MNKLIIILITISLLAGCGKNETVNHMDEGTNHEDEHKSESVILSKESQETIKLETETVKVETFKGYLKIPAVVISDQNYEAQVSPIVAGKVKKVYASVGSYVKAGQTLILIEGLEIGVLKADFLKSKTTLDFTEQEYVRQKSLMEQNAGSQKNLISAKSDFDKAVAEFNAMDKKIHSIGLKDDDIVNQKNDLHSAGDLAIKSPISGVIVERNVVVGQYLEPSSIAFKILNTSSLLVDGQIYENDLSKLTNSTSIDFISPSFPDEVFACNLTYTGQVIDENTRTIKVRAKILNPRNKLLPQMFGELRIPVGESSKGLFVPEESIVKIDNQDYVFVQINDTAFVKVSVTVGIKQNNRIEIKQGLSPGDKYVVKGAFYLKSDLMKESLEGDEH